MRTPFWEAVAEMISFYIGILAIGACWVFVKGGVLALLDCMKGLWI